MRHRVLHDITWPVSEATAVWPGDASFRLDWTLRIREGAAVNLSELHLSAHTGTHADAPLHSADGGDPIGDLPLEPFMGEAAVIDAEGYDAVTPDLLTACLGDAWPQRILVRTGCWTRADHFPQAFPAFDPAAVELLAEAGVRLVGTDAPSVDPFDSRTLPAHHALRRAGITNLESLRLEGVPVGRYFLIALPLRLAGADASPVRAVLCSLV